MKRGQHRRGYALLDVVLAVALFSISVSGLVGVLQRINETSASFARDRVIQENLEVLLAEKKRSSLGEMTSEIHDARLDATFRTRVESIEVDNGEGNTLTDLYKLTAEATFFDDGGEQVERAELIIHHPEP
ncbi:MAG: hypothetical protein WD342_20605 [Verrucomicrobiales bacterium]